MRNYIIYALLGAILALFPILEGSLAFIEQLYAAPIFAGLMVFLGLLTYGFVKSAPAEKAGDMTTKPTPHMGKQILASVVGSVITVILFAVL